MDYQTFVTTQFIPRVLGMQNGLKNNLVSAGVTVGNITVEEVTSEGVNDLRYRIVAKKGSKTLTAYVELTAAGIIDNQMALVITLWVDGNGTQINTTYNGGNPLRYDVESNLDTLVGKLTELGGKHTGELLTSARAFLNV